MDENASNASPSCLSKLNPDVLAAILCSPGLSVRDLSNAACSCRLLRDAAADDTRLWAPLVERGWGGKTTPSRWIDAYMRASASPVHNFGEGMNRPTPDFRSLHRVLTYGDTLNGWWKGLDSPKGSLYRLVYARDSIRALQLHGHTQSPELAISSLFKLGPAHSLNVAHSLDDMHLEVRCYAPPKAAPAAAEAAAAAATLASSPASFSSAKESRAAPCGSSPVSGSFANEVLRFMSHQVQPPRKATRRSQKRASSLSNSCQTTPTAFWGHPSARAAAEDDEEALGGGPEIGNSSHGARLDDSFDCVSSPSSSAPHASMVLGSSPQQVPGAGHRGSRRGGRSSSATAGGAGSISGWGSAMDAGLCGNNSTAEGASFCLGTSPRSSYFHAGTSVAQQGGGSSHSSALTQELRAQQVGSASPVLFGPAIATHHFVRLVPAAPSRQHPLLGLWKGVHGPFGLEVVDVRADFAHSSARMVATKATGDACVPAGQKSWYAVATPMPAREAVSGPEVERLESIQWPEHLLDEEGRPLPKLVSCHRGKGQVAEQGFRSPQWVDGRLWHFEGHPGQQIIVFLWLLQGTLPLCVVYTRVPE